MNVVVGITGASGSVYGKRLLEELLAGGHRCHLILSAAGCAVARHELEEDPTLWSETLPDAGLLTLWENSDLFAPFCSGSNPPSSMVVAPCSMGTLGRIASGVSDSLLTRAADVCLKERIPLILAARETPLGLIHLENMVRVTRAGGIILPASPGFYHRPAGMGELVDHVVGKILDTLGLPHSLTPRWEKPPLGPAS